jgi:hypothetical protein
MHHPGSMGIGISNWRLARAVSCWVSWEWYRAPVMTLDQSLPWIIPTTRNRGSSQY